MGIGINTSNHSREKKNMYFSRLTVPYSNFQQHFQWHSVGRNCKNNLYTRLTVRCISAAAVLLYTKIHFNIILSSSMSFTLIKKYQYTAK